MREFSASLDYEDLVCEYEGRLTVCTALASANQLRRWREHAAIHAVVEGLFLVAQFHKIFRSRALFLPLKVSVADRLLRNSPQRGAAGSLLDGGFQSPDNFFWEHVAEGRAQNSLSEPAPVSRLDMKYCRMCGAYPI